MSIIAISPWTCGTVKAGVWIFPPPGLLREEPGGQQRQSLVVVPPLPGADLVVPQPGLPLGPLEALLHLPAMMPPKVEVGWPERPATGPLRVYRAGRGFGFLSFARR